MLVHHNQQTQQEQWERQLRSQGTTHGSIPWKTKAIHLSHEAKRNPGHVHYEAKQSWTIMSETCRFLGLAWSHCWTNWQYLFCWDNEIRYQHLKPQVSTLLYCTIPYYTVRICWRSPCTRAQESLPSTRPQRLRCRRRQCPWSSWSLELPPAVPRRRSMKASDRGSIFGRFWSTLSVDS